MQRIASRDAQTRGGFCVNELERFPPRARGRETACAGQDC